MSDRRDPLDIVMMNGRRLTAAQLDRRRFNLGLLASGAFATLAGVGRGAGAFAQAATPAATPEATPVADYDGPLAEVQEIRLPTTEPTTMDPGVSYGDDEIDIFYNIFDGLVGIDQKTGEVVPRVAESFTFNDDASEYTFKIRQGVTWSDGAPLNANDFVYAWKRILDPELAAQYISALYPIKNAEAIANAGVPDANGATPAVTMTPDDLGVVATDDYTLTVTLEGPTAFFPLLLTTWTFSPVPKHVVDKAGAQWVEADNIVCNGPYKMTAWNHDQNIVLELNDNYYGDKPTITKATYTILQDTSADSYVPFQNNELDYCAPDGPSLETARADTTSDQTVISFQLSNTYFVVCDTTNSPTDKMEFRQALYKSLDRETLANNVLKGSYVPALTLLPDNIPGHNPDAALGESVDDAKALLTAAGVDPSSVDLQLTFINSEYYTTVAQYLQAGWQNTLGIKITLNPIEDSAYSDWRAARETTPFNIYTGSWGSDFADASNWFNQNFTHASDHYRNHWNDPEFDALVAKAVVNTDTKERDQQYSDAEAMLVQQAPIVPFLHGVAFRFVKPWVKDLYIQPITSIVHLRTIKIAQH